MQTITRDLYVFKPRSEDPYVTVYMRLTIDRKPRYSSLSKQVHYSKWNSKSKEVEVEPGNLTDKKLNRFLLEKKLLMDDVILELQKKHKHLTHDQIFQLFNGEGSLTFKAFVEDYIVNERTNLSNGSVKRIEGVIRKMERYQNDVKLIEINSDWIEGYSAHYRQDGNDTNTLASDLTIISKYLNKACIKKLIEDNPFDDIEIKRVEVEKDYLTIPELNRLLQFYLSGKLLEMKSHDRRGKTYCIGRKYQETLQHFLIGCFTGLRKGNVNELRRSHLDWNNHCLEIEINKTRVDEVRIVRPPINDQLLSVLDLEDGGDKVYQGKVRMTSNDLNEYIRDIMEFAGVAKGKHLTFHGSRHTYGVTCATLGVPVETIQTWMGHKQITTTMIYVKIADQKRNQDRLKWNNFDEFANQDNNFIRRIA